MAYRGQRYEADDFGYPGSRHGDRQRYQQTDQRRYDDPRDAARGAAGSQNRYYDDVNQYSERDRPRNQQHSNGMHGVMHMADDDQRDDRRDDRRRDDRRRDDMRRDDVRDMPGQQRGGQRQEEARVVERCMEMIREKCKSRGVSGIKTMGR